MKATDDPKRYSDPEFRERAYKSAPLLGETAATELRAALDALKDADRRIGNLVDGLKSVPDDNDHHVSYAVNAIATDLDTFFEDPDPAEAYEKLYRVQQELKALV